MTIACGPALVNAEPFSLTCKEGTAYSVNFTIDPKALSVTTDGLPARSVSINETSINFVVDLKDGGYFHLINRLDGKLTIRTPRGEILNGHQCELSKQKF